MTTHIPTRHGQLYTCPACPWRGVVTARGVITTAPGAPDTDHLAGIAVQEQHAAAIIARLNRHKDAGAIDAAQQIRLIAAVLGEYR